MRRRLYEAGAFAAVGMTLGALGGNLLGAGYPGWGKTFIVIGCILVAIAVIVFLWDVGAWVEAKIAERKPRLQLGTMDYLPDFLKAASSFNSAQGRITASTSAVTARMVKASSQLGKETDLTKRQSIAIAIAADISVFCGVMDVELPGLAENAAVMDEALSGYVKIATDSTADLITMRGQTRDLRAKIGGLRQSLRIGQRNTKSLHRQNRNVQLNQATDRQLAGLREYDRIAARAQRTLSRVAGSLRRKIWIRSVKRVLLRRAN